MNLKKIVSVCCISIGLIFLFSSAKATEECFERLSRSIFKFNIAFDNIVLEPIAKGYNKLPTPVRKGTSNFTSNIGTLLSIPNNVLQGNFKQLGHSIGSFALNTSIGILGFFNPAEKMGLKPNREDVGQTFRKIWIWTWVLLSSANTWLAPQGTRLDYSQTLLLILLLMLL